MNWILLLCQDDDEDRAGYNTSDEEFERQLEEAAMIEEVEKAEKVSSMQKLVRQAK